MKQKLDSIYLTINNIKYKYMLSKIAYCTQKDMTLCFKNHLKVLNFLKMFFYLTKLNAFYVLCKTPLNQDPPSSSKRRFFTVVTILGFGLVSNYEYVVCGI